MKPLLPFVLSIRERPFLNVSRRILNRFLLVAATSLLFALATPGQGQSSAAPQLESSDPLSPLNAAFREAYSDLRSRIIKETSPIIVHLGDTMVLIKNGVRTEAPGLTVRYHELKAVAHVPLALDVMLVSGAGSKLDDARLHQLRQYRELVLKGRDSIAGRGFRPDQRGRQLRILDRALALVDSTLASGLVKENELRESTRSQSQDILANAHDAAEDQIETMDRQLKSWLADMTPEERTQLRVAVGSVHMARVGNLPMQYFSAILNEPFEGRFEEEEIKDSDFRLIFAESTFDEPGLLKLLGAHLLDAEVGVRFFGDDQRMHRDLLSDAAEQIISDRLARKPAARR